MKCLEKVLYISYCAPYDGVRHAGGKTHNFYLKRLSKEFDIKLVTFVKNEEIPLMDLDEYGIDHVYINYPCDKKNRIYSKIINIESKLNPFNKFGGFVSNYERLKMKKVINGLSKSGYIPNLILLEWTQILFFLPIIKECFPGVPVFTIEVDVAFLGKERGIENIDSFFRKKLATIRAKRIKQLEVQNLKNVCRIYTNNEKDKLILEKNGICSEVVDILTPFYDDYSSCEYNNISHDILFYGAMDRPENWKTAIWFIDNVMPLLGDDYSFTVVGNHPSKELVKKATPKVNVTGFVESVNPYFEHSLCLASPLLLGAGVKVKIIEAMSSGIPVVCNHISIEGINAIEGRDYLYCETPEEFSTAIKKLAENKQEAIRIGSNGKDFILDNYNYCKDCDKLISQIRDAINAIG